MSTQLDPVTGLPMYVPPPLEQIPFKNPPYPWKDLTDSPVAPRTTYYGDDSIPTVSTVAGMLPDTPGGETVETDGNHALKVSVVNGGSGGGQPVPITCYRIDETTAGFGSEQVTDLGPIGSVIYGLTMSFTSDDTPTSTLVNHGVVYPFIDSSGPSDPLILASVAIEQVALTTANMYVGNCTVWYGNGITFPDALDPGNGKYRLQLQSTNIGGGNLIIAVWCSA